MASKRTKPADTDGFEPADELGAERPKQPEGEGPKRTEELAALAQAGPPVAPLFAEGKQPPHGTARRAADLPAPRLCHQLERAGDGLSRFKIRAEVPGGNQRVKYVLAADRDEAEQLYRDKFNLEAEHRLVVTELPD